MECYSRKRKNPSVCNYIDELEDTVLSDTGRTETDKTVVSHLHLGSKKKYIPREIGRGCDHRSQQGSEGVHFRISKSALTWQKLVGTFPKASSSFSSLTEPQFLEGLHPPPHIPPSWNSTARNSRNAVSIPGPRMCQMEGEGK